MIIDRLGLALFGLALAAFTARAVRELKMAREWRRREQVWERRQREARQRIKIETRSVD